MYAVICREKVIAFHDEKRVVKCYMNHIKEKYKDRLIMWKVKKRDEEKINSLYDLYLIRYGDTYIQSGYLKYLRVADPQFEYDHQYAKDVLMKVLEIEELSKKERKSIKKSISLLERLITIDREYTPTLDELERIKDHYAPYLDRKDYGI